MRSKEEDIQKSKPVSRLKHSLTYGNLWLYILSLLKEKKQLYAYTLDEEIEKEFFFKPHKIMLYVVLYKLEEEGFIKAKQKTKERRKYYYITKKGEKILRYAKEYMNSLSKRL